MTLTKFNHQTKHNRTISTEITMKILKVCTKFVGWSLEALPH